MSRIHKLLYIKKSYIIVEFLSYSDYDLRLLFGDLTTLNLQIIFKNHNFSLNL